MSNNYARLGKRIKQLRLRNGYSQEKLAELVNISSTYVSRVENGTKGISLDTFIQITKILNASPDELLADYFESIDKPSNQRFLDMLQDCSDEECKFVIDVMTKAKKFIRNNDK